VALIILSTQNIIKFHKRTKYRIKNIGLSDELSWKKSIRLIYGLYINYQLDALIIIYS